MYVNGRLIGYGIVAQVKDLIGYFIAALACAGAVWLLGRVLPWHPYLVMFIQVVVFLVLYLGISRLFRFSSYYTYLDVVKTYLKRIKK